jgi:hypothetical protein
MTWYWNAPDAKPVRIAWKERRNAMTSAPLLHASFQTAGSVTSESEISLELVSACLAGASGQTDHVFAT